MRYDQQDNKRIVASFVNDLWNNHNADAWDATCSEAYVAHHGFPDVPPSREGMKQLSKNVLAAFPDTKLGIQFLLVHDDLVIQRSTTTATYSGRHKTIPPSHKQYTWHSTHIYRLTEGKIVEQWSEERLERLLWQLENSQAVFTNPERKLLHKVIATVMKGLARFVWSEADQGSTRADVEAKNLKIVYAYVQKFKNEQKYHVFPRLFDHRFSHHFDFPGLPGNLETFISVGQGLLPAFSELHVDLQTLVADGEYVVERNVVNALHNGAWVGIEPTRRKVKWSEIHIYRLENGKIIENWPLVNFERILMQIR